MTEFNDMIIIGAINYNDNYGIPRMHLALKQCRHKVGICQLTRIMRELGLIHKPHRTPKGLTHTTTEIHEKEILEHKYKCI